MTACRDGTVEWEGSGSHVSETGDVRLGFSVKHELLVSEILAIKKKTSVA